MQLCALDSKNSLVFAHLATKHQDYICLECQKTVRVRSGFHRQPHFFHIHPNQACRQHGKGMVHLLLQYYLKAQLPEGEVFVEHRFDHINRIADVAWIPKRLVYEIQYSPISAEEISARNQAYASIGYQVIWILHDCRYNKRRATSAEDILQASPHYYTNMDAEGEGIIYDEFALFEKGLRTFRLPRHQIDFTAPKHITEEIAQLLKQLPKPLRARAKSWPLGFVGDTLDRCAKISPDNDEALMKGIEYLSKKFDDPLSQPLGKAIISNFRKYIAAPYFAILRLFLERACR